MHPRVPISRISVYVDEVIYTPGATPPILISQPLSQSQIPGGNTTFTVTAGGTPPLSWQWHFNDQDLIGATAGSLSITNVASTNLGNYTVTMSNTVGTILSSNASLEFGQLTAWGLGGYGATMTPPGATNLLAVAAGNYFGLALKADGTLLAWGNDAQGQVSGARSISNAVAIAAKDGNCLALSDGIVVAWGDNSTNVPVDLTNAVAIAAGTFHNLALTSDGNVVTWGLYGNTNPPPGLTNAVAIVPGTLDSIAATASGSVVEWGSGPALPVGLSNVVGVATGGAHYLALLEDGTIMGWGNNTYGQATPPPGISNIVAIAAGDLYSTALLADGTLVALGNRFRRSHQSSRGINQCQRRGGRLLPYRRPGWQ